MAQYLENLAKTLHGAPAYGAGRVAGAIRVSRLTADTTIRRTSTDFELRGSTDGPTVVTVAARSLTYPARAHHVLSWLAERDETRIAEIPHDLGETAVRKLVNSLIEVGVFEFAEE